MEDRVFTPVTSQIALTPSGVSTNQGLQYFGTLNEFVVKQLRPSCLELFGCWEYNNRFAILDKTGSTIFKAKEKSTCAMRYFCGNLREFMMDLFVNEEDSEPVLTFERPLNCMGCCCHCCYPSCMQELTVHSGSKYLGKIIEYPTWWKKKLEIFNENDKKICDVKGPCLILPCGCNNIFNITKNKEIIGQIEQKSRGCFMDALTDMTTFVVEVPLNFNVNEKALLLGATILMDMMYFEKNQNDNNH